MKKLDIIVNGSGMVGSACALGMAQLGLTVGVVFNKEKYIKYRKEDPISMQSCAVNINSEMLLTKIGTWSWIKKQRINTYNKLEVTEEPNDRLTFESSKCGLPYLGHFIENRIIETANINKYDEQENINLLPNLIESFNTDEDKTIVTFEDGEQIETRLLIGADGSNSFVREHAGIKTKGHEYDESALIIKIKSNKIDPDITKQQFCTEGARAILPLANQEALLVWYNNNKINQKLVNLSNEELKEKTKSAFRNIITDFEILDKTTFNLRKVHAKKYSYNRTLLIGDAAHSVHPFAGQGVNMGFKDVTKLLKRTEALLRKKQDPFAPYNLSVYTFNRYMDNEFLMSTLDALDYSFHSENQFIQNLRQLLFNVPNRLKNVKNKMMMYAVGIQT